MESEFKHSEITEIIVGCAYEVYNELGFGFLESVYQKAMLILLREKGLVAEEELPVTVYFRNKNVGSFEADLLVENCVIVELKSIRQFAPTHEVQLVNYLVATRLDTGLLLNFGPNGVDVKRKARRLPTR